MNILEPETHAIVTNPAALKESGSLQLIRLRGRGALRPYCTIPGSRLATSHCIVSFQAIGVKRTGPIRMYNDVRYGSWILQDESKAHCEYATRLRFVKGQHLVKTESKLS